MIILDNNGIKRDIYFQSKNQIEGSQSVLREYPSGLLASCHYYNNNFGVGKIDFCPGIIEAARHCFDIYFPEKDEDELILKKLDIIKAWDDKISGKDFDDDDWKCFMNKGFLGILEKNCPELKENEVFNYYISLDKAVKDLETRLLGQPYSEVLKEIQSHSENEGSEDQNLWQAINYIYNSNSLWIKNKENGTGGQRNVFVNYLEEEKDIKSKSRLGPREEEKTSLEETLKTVKESLKELEEKQTNEQGIGG